MTISSTTAKIIYVGTGSTASSAKIFSYPFKIFASDDLVVSEYNNATSSATVKTNNTDYEVSGVGVDSGGNVTLTGSYTNVPSGSQLIIQRIIDLTQGVDYVSNDAFPAETHEQALDRLTMITQQLQEQIGRAILADVSQTASNINVVASVLAANSSAAVAVQQATLVSSYTAAVTTFNPTFTGTTNVTTLVGTLLSATTLNVSGTSTVVTLRATLLTSTTLNVSGTANIGTVGGDLASVAWADYGATSIITGWSAFANKEIYTKKIGKLCFTSFYLNGSSNATTISFTTPYLSNSAPTTIRTFCHATDNAVEQSHGALLVLNTGTSTAAVYLNAALATWSNTGIKIIAGQLFYETT